MGILSGLMNFLVLVAWQYPLKRSLSPTRELKGAVEKASPSLPSE
jgi:hypothetical protein